MPYKLIKKSYSIDTNWNSSGRILSWSQNITWGFLLLVMLVEAGTILESLPEECTLETLPLSEFLFWISVPPVWSKDLLDIDEVLFGTSGGTLPGLSGFDEFVSWS
jgi:hypothetical protein